MAKFTAEMEAFVKASGVRRGKKIQCWADRHPMDKIQILANIWVLPKAGKKLFDYKVKLDKFADWQVLKEFSFGTLAWDYEEGFMFQTTPQQLAEFANWARSLDLDPVNAKLTWMGPDIPTFEKEFKAAGFKRDKKYSFQWNLQ